MKKNSVQTVVSPICDAKSVKSAVELEGMRRSHVRDAVALVTYFCWLEKEMAAGVAHTECSVADKLEELRRSFAVRLWCYQSSCRW